MLIIRHQTERSGSIIGFATDKANSVRVYDYLIGGTHNGQADRVVEQHILATELPTERALYEFVPASAKVLYNDIDPEAIGYGRPMVGGWPNIRYIQAEVRDINLVLAAAEDFFGSERHIRLCLIGVVYFIENETLQHIFQRLYEWAAPGSHLVVSSVGYQVEEATAKQAAERYVQQTGLRYYPRLWPELLRLAEPWQPYQDSIKPLEDHAETHIGMTITLDTRRGKLGAGGMLIHP